MDASFDHLAVGELEMRMRPGSLSQGGFLGKNEKLQEVMNRDDKTLKELGLTHEEMAARLDALLQAAISSPRRSAVVGNFSSNIKLFTGFQMCPWSPDIHHSQCTAGGGVDYGSIDWHIKNLRTAEELRGPGLAVHLIRDHHFFEGISSPYRVDPHILASLLEIGPSKL
jgi:hypothetical protein